MKIRRIFTPAREAYTLRFVYQDPATAGTAGTGTHRFNTIAGFSVLRVNDPKQKKTSVFDPGSLRSPVLRP